MLCLGDYLHLTRQHWISSLSLILPGNDDDSHLPTANSFSNVSISVLWAWAPDRLENFSSSSRNGSQDPSYLTVLDCTTVVLTLSGNDVSWVTLWSPVIVAHQVLNPKMWMTVGLFRCLRVRSRHGFVFWGCKIVVRCLTFYSEVNSKKGLTFLFARHLSVQMSEAVCRSVTQKKVTGDVRQY